MGEYGLNASCGSCAGYYYCAAGGWSIGIGRRPIGRFGVVSLIISQIVLANVRGPLAGGKGSVMQNNQTKCDVANLRRSRRHHLLISASLMFGAAAGITFYSGAFGAESKEPEVSATPTPGQEPLEYGEFLARPEELAAVATNDIVKSLRLNHIAMIEGATVYEKNCAGCHGAELKGLPAQHAPDLTDSNWMFSGDDLQSGGMIKFPSDVEWTVRYGVRSGHENARGNEADMLAYDPQFRNEDDTKEFGSNRFLTPLEIEDVVEYVLKLSGQTFNAAKASRGDVLFHDNATGNCFDCHTDEGTGNDAIGSANLTRKNLFLYGSDRASILESITKGRHGVMPAFEKVLTPGELKAVSVFVFSHARN
jgi:cbb3-type cytochrome c oxidase subunit III